VVTTPPATGPVATRVPEHTATPTTPLPRAGRLRIGVLAPPWFTVPPERYGGIEAVVALLADGLADRGHDVTLFASGGSVSEARIVDRFGEPPTELLGRTDADVHHALLAFEHRDDLDVLTGHCGVAGIVIGELTGVPSLHTVHGTLSDGSAPLYERVMAAAPGACLASLTHAQRRPAPNLPWVANLPNAIDLDSHVLVEGADRTYVAWLGRMSEDKGPDRAIRVARSAGVPIRLAGKMLEPAERSYFEQHVEPLLGDDAVYVGEVDADGRNRLLAGARALLMPIDWDEPFGLAMIEAMACGVPVIANRRGSVPEVIEPGRSGLIVEDEDAMVEALRQLDGFDPRECRAAVEERFSPDAMVGRYEQALRRVLELSRADAARLPS